MKQHKEKKSGGGDNASKVKELKPWPSYIQDRLDLWDKLKVKYEEELASKPQLPIKVTLPDGKQVDAVAWKSTAYDVAKSIRFVFYFTFFRIE